MAARCLSVVGARFAVSRSLQRMTQTKQSIKGLGPRLQDMESTTSKSTFHNINRHENVRLRTEQNIREPYEFWLRVSVSMR